jgi:hypothetical protein
MFLSAAHRPADIDEALQAASHGFKAVRELEAKISSSAPLQTGTFRDSGP